MMNQPYGQEPECQVPVGKVPSSKFQVPTAHWAAGRAYRRAMDQRNFSGPQLRLINQVLRYSHDAGRYRALVPLDSFLGMLCWISRPKVSEELNQLRAWKVLDWELLERVVSGRRLVYAVYWLNPPEQWTAHWRGPQKDNGAAYWEGHELTEIEAWLEVLDENQAELWTPPASLNEMLRQDFAERCARTGRAPGEETPRTVPGCETPRTVPGCETPRTVPGCESGSPGGAAETEGNAKARVPSSETFVEPTLSGGPPGGTLPGPVTQEGTEAVAAPAGQGSELPNRELDGSPTGNCAVPCQGTGASASSTRDSKSRESGSARLVGSEVQVPQGPSTRASSPIGNCGAEFRRYVEGRLWETIGLRERNGRSGWLWKRALEAMPEELDSLISELLDVEASGRLHKSRGAWLNHYTYRRLQEKGGK